MAALLSHLQTSLLSPAEPAALPALLPLLALHQPFASAQAGPEATKFLRALDALVVGKDEAGRLVGWTVAREVLEQEARGGQRARDGGCIERYGRSWVTTLVGLAGVRPSTVCAASLDLRADQRTLTFDPCSRRSCPRSCSMRTPACCRPSS
jgi:hypothetical protein